MVMTACASEDEAELIINALLAGRQAACIQMTPVTSHYIWDGERQCSRELLLFIKCLAENYDAIEKTILKLHSYDTPEIIRVPIEGGYDRYLSWLAEPV